MPGILPFWQGVGSGQFIAPPTQAFPAWGNPFMAQSPGMNPNPFVTALQSAKGQASGGYYPLQTYGDQLRTFLQHLQAAQAQPSAPVAPQTPYTRDPGAQQAEQAGREVGAYGIDPGAQDLGLGGVPGNPSGIFGFEDPAVTAAMANMPSSPGFSAGTGARWGGAVGAATGIPALGLVGAGIGALASLFSGGQQTPSVADMATSASDAPAGASIGEFGGQMGDVGAAEKAGRGGVDPG